MNNLKIIDLGFTPYRESYLFQRRILNDLIRGESEDVLLLAEHPVVITMGRRGTRKHIYADRELLKKEKIGVLEVDRGGDVTIHCPGQLVTYPLFDLNRHKKDIRLFINKLETALSETLLKYGLVADKGIDLTGVWVEGKKIGFIGIGVSHWITYHGASLNINNDLEYFSIIKPCGIDGLAVSNLKNMLNREVPMNDLKEVMAEKYCEVFDFATSYKSEKDAMLVKEGAS
jgi:lipoate-protein ligase B